MADYILVYDNTPLIRFSDGLYPVYFPYVRKENPNTSFPIPFRDTLLAPFGYGPVIATTKPKADVVTEGTPEQGEDGKYYQTWVTRDFTEEEIANNLAAQKEQIMLDASNQMSMDIGLGIEYKFKDVDYLVSVGQDSLTLLLAMKSLAKEAEDGQSFNYSFQGQQLVEMTKDEFLTMITTVFQTIYNINNNFWQFREEVNSKTIITDLPDVPTTFK